MRFKTINKNVFKDEFAKYGKCQKLVMDFAEEGVAIAEVVEHDYKTAALCAVSLRQSITRMGMEHITAFARKGHVYMLNLLEI